MTTAIVLSDHENKDIKEVILILIDSDGIEFLYRQQDFICFSFDTEANRLAAMTQLLHRSYTVRQDNGLPLDFPLLPISATAEEINQYAQQKATWIEASPQRYESAQHQGSTIVISQTEFDLLPQEKQEFILSQPDIYVILP